MNSKQRRKDRRKWRYKVLVSNIKLNENGYENMFNWCMSTFGQRGDWRETFGHIGSSWEFAEEKEAALFALRWGG